MRFIHAVALGLAGAVVATGGVFTASAHRERSKVRFGPNCQPLTLVSAALMKGYAEPSVCVIRDAAGKRFYLFSGVFSFVAGPQVQVRFGVRNDMPLFGATLVPVTGYAGSDPSDTYDGYGMVAPNGQIRVEGTKPGWRYTVSVSAEIPAGIPAG